MPSHEHTIYGVTLPHMRILVIENEKRLAHALADTLTKENLAVDIVANSAEGMARALSGVYDAAIVGAAHGSTLLPKLRRRDCGLPVLTLCGNGDGIARAAMLDGGADYCLSLPLEMKELAACMHALLRRPAELNGDAIHFGDVSLVPGTGVLQCGGNAVQLGKTELALMRLLMAGGGTIVSKETLFLKVWGYGARAEANVVEAYVSFLRKKLRHINAHIQIKAVWGQGYRLSGLPADALAVHAGAKAYTVSE